ncbi:MAG: 4-hydroxy-tetrahydrodipicolinate synthase [Balneolales bacterium]
MALHKFNGLSVALVTPMDENLEIDRKAYEAHLDYQIEGGVDHLVVCGTTGESPTIRDDEFEYLLSKAVEMARGRCGVIAGTGTNSTVKSIERSLVAEKLGSDGILLVAPYYNKPSQRGLSAHFRAIADSVSLPGILYNVPGRASVNIDPDTIATLSGHPNIAAAKEASGDINQIMDILASVPEGFTVLAGDDAMTLPTIASGGHGVISVAANEAPDLMKTYVDACLDGDFSKGRHYHYLLLPLLRANFWESNPVAVKAALSLMGRMKNTLRLPLVPMDEKYIPRLKMILSDIGLDVQAAT